MQAALLRSAAVTTRSPRAAPAVGVALAAALTLGACDQGPLGAQAIAPCDEWHRTERWGITLSPETLLQECQVQTSEIEAWAGRNPAPGGGYPTRARIQLHHKYITEGYALLRLGRWPEAELAFDDAITMLEPVPLSELRGASSKTSYVAVAMYGRGIARERQGKAAEGRADIAAATATDMMLTPELRRKLEAQFGRAGSAG